MPISRAFWTDFKAHFRAKMGYVFRTISRLFWSILMPWIGWEWGEYQNPSKILYNGGQNREISTSRANGSKSGHGLKPGEEGSFERQVVLHQCAKQQVVLSRFLVSRIWANNMLYRQWQKLKKKKRKISMRMGASVGPFLGQIYHIALDCLFYPIAW